MPSAGMPSARWSAATVLPAARTILAGEVRASATAGPPPAEVSNASATAAAAQAASRRAAHTQSVVGTARTPPVSAPTGLAGGLARRPALRRGYGDSPREPLGLQRFPRSPPPGRRGLGKLCQAGQLTHRRADDRR